MNKTRKHLMLYTETLRALRARDLACVGGGGQPGGGVMAADSGGPCDFVDLNRKTK
jgi:hypothetical protein